ncbi:uncharacterized protein LOC126900602 isoform X2 [Daktulosphaira vitifoliae]|uniref:uncharacterized protein LOC126900602 isoform X2 n=1 Tax=Daktulosphaira vitifoliae TaxID=58002 RepID=UPI0021A9F1D3|nr:uncharacterized protein LOC126900602 isoform X2 [Daktulosphaira vitifoliae]
MGRCQSGEIDTRVVKADFAHLPRRYPVQIVTELQRHHVTKKMKIYLISSALCLGAAAACFGTTGHECGDLGPPPSILEMPPPPMPSFLAAVLDDQLGNNESNSPHSNILIETNELEPGKPCKSMCDVDQGVGFVELPQHGPIIEGYSFWMFVSTCLLGVMLVGTIILVVIMRLKEKHWSKSDYSPEPKKSPNLYDTIDISPKTFWATLSPTGNIDTTATVRRPVHHHPQTIANPNFENGAFYPYDQQHIYQQIDTIRRIPEYQTIRPRVSSPTRIEHPNMPPLNLYRSIRRISDLESP